MSTEMLVVGAYVCLIVLKFTVALEIICSVVFTHRHKFTHDIILEVVSAATVIFDLFLFLCIVIFRLARRNRSNK
jgi:hypothetical protein